MLKWTFQDPIENDFLIGLVIKNLKNLNKKLLFKLSVSYIADATMNPGESPVKGDKLHQKYTCWKHHTHWKHLLVAT